MKNQIKLVLAVAIFTVSTLLSFQNSFGKQRATTGGCDSSDGECGFTTSGEQICGSMKC